MKIMKLTKLHEGTWKVTNKKEDLINLKKDLKLFSKKYYHIFGDDIFLDFFVKAEKRAEQLFHDANK